MGLTALNVITQVITSGSWINQKITGWAVQQFNATPSQATGVLAIGYCLLLYLTITLAEKLGKPALRIGILAILVWLILGIFATK